MIWIFDFSAVKYTDSFKNYEQPNLIETKIQQTRIDIFIAFMKHDITFTK